MNNNTINMGSNKGFTLMELLLVTALLGVITAASFGIIYWQMRVQSHVTQNAVLMSRLVNTQIMMRKALRAIPPASLTVDVDKIEYLRTGLPTKDIFSVTGNSLHYNSLPILEGVNASFSKLLASGSIDPAPAIATLSADCTNLIRIELTTLGRERRNISFLVRPRGQ